MTLRLKRGLRLLTGIAIVAISGTAAQCQTDARATVDSASAAAPVPSGAGATFDPPTVPVERQKQFMLTSARTAWSYVRRNYSSTSGLVKSLDNWDLVTIWDISSALAAYHSARGLGLIDDADYRRRMDRALKTLEAMPLYLDVAYNKTYSSRSATMVGRDEKPSTTGYGWSVIDMGRFLVWLKIIAENDPVARPAVERIVQRLALDRLTADGYLRGGNIDVNTKEHLEYQEGRLGYEQYAAQGLSLWGAQAPNALTFDVNGKATEIFGHRVLGDRRGADLITSEPFVMAGIELGWATPAWEEQARNVLAAQRERFRKTKLVTMVSEDAVPLPPAHFYYYGLLADGRQFVVQAPGGATSDKFPRWVSVKAAFGYHALFPSDYTWTALQTVRPAGASGRGWTAGVFERSKRATPSFNLNTAAIVLEAAYYAQRNCPLIKPSCS
jgi:hypothetical protein